MVNLDISALLVTLTLSILLLMLQKLYFKPINNILQKREKVLRENKESFALFLNEYNEKARILNEILKNASIEVEKHKEKVRKEAIAEKEAIIEKAKKKAEELKENAFKKFEEEVKSGKLIIEREIDSLSEKLIKNILNQRN